MELFKNHYKYPKYKGSTEGRVFNTNFFKKGIECEVSYFQHAQLADYVGFGLYCDGKTKNYSVHRFIWECFNGPIPDGLEVDHIDGDPKNNKLENLRLGTHKANCNNPNTIRKKKESQGCNKKPVIVREWLGGKIVKICKTVKEAVEVSGVSALTIARHCNAQREPRSTPYSFSWAN